MTGERAGQVENEKSRRHGDLVTQLGAKAQQQQQQASYEPELRRAAASLDLRQEALFESCLAYMTQKAYDWTLSTKTVELAFRYLHRVLLRVDPDGINSLNFAKSCLLLAIKFNEPVDRMFCFNLVSEDVDYMRKLELLVLRVLEWKMNVPCSSWMVESLADYLEMSPSSYTVCKANEIVLSSLRKGEFVGLDACELGAAAFFVAIDSFSLSDDTDVLVSLLADAALDTGAVQLAQRDLESFINSPLGHMTKRRRLSSLTSICSSPVSDGGLSPPYLS